jgi:hypothetical protein
MDTSEIGPDDAFNRSESLHPTSPILGDLGETERPISDSVDLLDDEKIEEDGK